MDDVEGDDDEQLTDYESVLDVCCSLGLPRRRLRWHYRSRREGLIAFSNRFYYGGDLVTFPSARDAGTPAVGFEFVSAGRYVDSVNPAEARRVAELVVEHFRGHPDQSLGVIAFSQKQQFRILDELDALRKELLDREPGHEKLFREFRPEPFFVKNLENVQGDERDVIFLGVGYGPDAAGKVAMRFGPLNRQGGERRLNVAVTPGAGADDLGQLDPRRGHRPVPDRGRGGEAFEGLPGLRGDRAGRPGSRSDRSRPKGLRLAVRASGGRGTRAKRARPTPTGRLRRVPS